MRSGSSIMQANMQQRKISQDDKENIVSELKAGNVDMKLLAGRYEVNQSRISQVFKEMTGGSYKNYIVSVSNGQGVMQNYQHKMKHALKESQYSAWHKEEKKMFPVLGLDWFNQKLLIAAPGAPEWYSMDLFMLMKYSGLRDRKRTREYQEGQRIFEGDIVQFPILQSKEDGKPQKIIHTDVVAFDHETGWFIFVGTSGDPVGLYNDECEVMGNIYAHPEMASKELYELWCNLDKHNQIVAPSSPEHYNQ